MRFKIFVSCGIPIFVGNQRTEGDQLKNFSELKADRFNGGGLKERMAAFMEKNR